MIPADGTRFVLPHPHDRRSAEPSYTHLRVTCGGCGRITDIPWRLLLDRSRVTPGTRGTASDSSGPISNQRHTDPASSISANPSSRHRIDRSRGRHACAAIPPPASALTGQGLFAVILIGKAVIFLAIEARTVTLWGKRCEPERTTHAAWRGRGVGEFRAIAAAGRRRGRTRR
jgi:hypothetical protein